MRGNLFSESWYKVANLRLALSVSVDVQKQYYRGEPWYVLRSNINSAFFRISPEGYAFIAMLTPDCTVEEVWERCIAEHKEGAPAQDEVIAVLSQLYANNLLHFKNIPNADHIFERRSAKQRKQAVNTALSLISVKIPLWNPDRFLAALQPLFGVLFNRYAFFAWFLVVGLGVKAVIDEAAFVYDGTQGMLAPTNLPYLYLGLVLLKVAHEFGHAAVTKHLGGNVTTMGVMFLLLTPLPYVDATSSWFFRERSKRILVSGAGMLVDLFLAALAALVWARTGDGVLHSVAFNIMMMGSISSIFFNGNPLIRFDSYYIVSDLLEIPNLYERSRQQWLYWLEHLVFGVKQAEPPALDGRETLWLAGYGILSFGYRCLLSVTILLVVADRFLALGLLLLAITLLVGVVMPLRQFAAYLGSSPKLHRVRRRAAVISCAAAASVAAFVGFFPLPSFIKAPGVIELAGYAPVYATTEGRLERVNKKNGEPVARGDVIAELSNRELELEIESVRARLSQTAAMKQKAHHEGAADLKPLAERGALLGEQLSLLSGRKRELRVIAPAEGIFVAPGVETYQGKWLKRQTRIGTLVAPGQVRFSAIVSQEQAFDLFRSRHLSGTARLHGRAGQPLELSSLRIIPYQREELPSAALGWFGGGDVAVSSADKSGKKVSEPFFEVSGVVDALSPDDSPALLHGRSGVMRIILPAEPLARQLYRRIMQTVQKRYKL